MARLHYLLNRSLYFNKDCLNCLNCFNNLDHIEIGAINKQKCPQ